MSNAPATTKPLRVVFIGKSHDFSLRPLDAVAASHDIVGIVESGPRHPPQGLVARAAAALRGALASPSALRRRAGERGVPHLLLRRGETASLNAMLEGVRPDLLVVASLSQLLAAKTIAIPRLGAINLHPSLLPKYPGPFPILWQYLELETTFGVTVHALDAREDAGDILEQEPFDVTEGTPLEEVLDRSASIGARLMAKAVDDLAAGRAVPRPQTGPRGPRAREVRRDEPLIDWERWPIERVRHAMIGTAPWLDPFRGEVRPEGPWRVGAIERGAAADAHGTVARDEQGWYVAHPEGKIRIEST